MSIQQLILDLYQIQVVQFGSFTLKSGKESPVYFDLRRIISFPKILETISKEMEKLTTDKPFDLICGVPYTAIPIATTIALKKNVPMVLKRKEKKNYGTGKEIEGIYHDGQTCLIVEDTMTTGSSILETIESLKCAGLETKDIVIAIDREQGGKEKLSSLGYQVHPLLTVSKILETLKQAELLDQETVSKTLTWLKDA